MKKLAHILVLAFAATFFLCGTSLAALDQYVGDSAIYSAFSQYLRPNVLLIIDNSDAASNTAAGEAYDPSIVYRNLAGNPQTYDTYDIWQAGQQGEFTQKELDNSTSTLENLTCTANSDIIRTTLLAVGTYTGRASEDYPSIKAGDCYNTKAYSYALGNYLNYLEQPPADGEAPQSQIEIVFGALQTVVGGARFAVNFGSMVYSELGQKGGKIITEVSDLSDDADFQDFLNKLPGSGHDDAAGLLTSQTARPQAEALLDAGYYFRGQALPVSGGSARTSPIVNTCDKNIIILITNGLSNKDNDGDLALIVGDYDNDGAEATAYGLGTHYLDDVAKYLYETDNRDLDGVQRIQTYTILAFQNSDPLVERAANASHGRGGYKNVFNANELAAALTTMLANIVLETDTSFVAPVVPTSPENRTYSGERVYLGFFKPISQRPWHGNLKKFGIDHQNNIIDRNGYIATLSDGSFSASASSFWSSTNDAGAVEEGGAGAMLLSRNLAGDPRKIYTNRGTSNDLTDSTNIFNSTNISAADLGVADTTARDRLIDYINGYDAYDDDGDGTIGDSSNGEKRYWILGDILHSKPQIVNYNSYEFTSENESAVTGSGSGSSCTYNKTMVYVGTNDGMLHAFRDCDGREEWAFIPDKVLPNLNQLAVRPAQHTFFVDASPSVYRYDKDDDGNIGPGPEQAEGDMDPPSVTDNGADDKVILFFGLRRGGDAYYVLDVTTPSSPQYLWKIDRSTSGFGELGQTWSDPQLGKVKYNTGFSTVDKVVAFIGAGYDNDNEDGRFGNTQGFTDTDVVSPTSDAGPVTTSGTLEVQPRDGSSPAPLENDPKGRGIYAFEVATLASDGDPTVPTSPVKVWDFTYAASAPGTPGYNAKRLMYAIPSDVTVMDTDYDGYTDRLYVGDTGGQLWRICAYNASNNRPYARAVINTAGDPWFGKRIFEANTAATNTTNPKDQGRKFFYRPSITLNMGGTFNLYIGSGDRAHPLNTAVTDRMYAIYDRGQITSEEKDEDNLVDVTDNLLQEDDTSAAAVAGILTRLYSLTNYGWYIKLDRLNDGSVHAGEKVLASPLAFNKVAYFTSYTPNSSFSADPCLPGNLGLSRLYALDYKTGEAVLNFANANVGTNNDDESLANNSRALGEDGEVLRQEDRATTLGVGIPSGLVVIMPPDGDAKLLIGCGGGLCSEDPAPGGTIIPIYWMTW